CVQGGPWRSLMWRYLLVSVGENQKKAGDAAKLFVAQKMPTRHSEKLWHAGVAAGEKKVGEKKNERGGGGKKRAGNDDAVVSKVAIAGTPAQVVEGIRSFLGTGLTLPIVWEIIGPDRRSSLSLIAKEVMPRLRG